jgi:glycyl-tRNA synthetase beta chain
MTKPLHYLLEIGCEEIPARFMQNLLNDLESAVKTALDKAKIPYEKTETFGTYRRLGLLIQGLHNESESSSQKLKGPLWNLVFDENKNLLPAGQGFIKRFALNEADIYCEEEQGKSYAYANKFTQGQSTAELLKTLIPTAILSLSLPIAMKWGNNQGPFIRPIHWIVSLFGKEIVPFTLFEIESGRQTYGHRMLTDNPTPGQIIQGAPLSVEEASPAFFDQLRTGYVEAQPEKRNNSIRKQLGQLGCELVEQSAFLIDEVLWIAEWPQAIKASFDQKYLEVPQEVLIETMIKNQKYFPIVKDKKLTHEFVIFTENLSPSNEATIRHGNETVLKARLEDAKFFWEEDKKTPLESKLEKLKTITFQKGLGSVYDKTKRIEALSQKIAADYLDPYPDSKNLAKAVQLCKADLASHMVYEFGNLQGIMGGYYAKAEGLDESICEGISQHYNFPYASNSNAYIIGLADTLDTLAACFSNNLIPTGSRDPLALRQGTFKIISALCNGSFEKRYFDLKKDVSLAKWISKAFDILEKQTNQEACLNFVKERIASYFKLSLQLPLDCIDAVEHHMLDAFYKAKETAEALSKAKENPEFKSLVETAVRVKRLGSTASTSTFSPDLFKEDAEKQAHEILKTVSDTPKLDDLYALVAPLTVYFDKVLVMDENKEVKDNRLGFLSVIHQRFLTVADFEKIII